MGIIEELQLFDRENAWNDIFQKIRSESFEKHKFSLSESRRPEYRSRNRYGDVSAYDHSRVLLQKGDINYINANIVRADHANRAYILTQGPLPHTISHFWLMVWEQHSPAVLMLNNMIERGNVKCHQYFPLSDSPTTTSMTFPDVHLKVTFVDEPESNNAYVIRAFKLECTSTGESRRVLQFHYTAWPDFGVPEPIGEFLTFLFKVRKFGFLDDPSKPPIIHCSAGIGRSGTFCLVDTCLVLAEKQGGVEKLFVLDELMMMRKFRMGLIQTPEQLRFTYIAIIEGARRLNCLNHPSLPQCAVVHNEEEEEDDEEEDEVDDDDVDEDSFSISSMSTNDGDEEEDDDDVDPRYINKHNKRLLTAATTTSDNTNNARGFHDDDDDDAVDVDDDVNNNKNDKNNNVRKLTRNSNKEATFTSQASNNNDNNNYNHDNNNKDNGNKDNDNNHHDDSTSSHHRHQQPQGSAQDKRAEHMERLERTRERLERMKQNQRKCEEEKAAGWLGGWMGGGSGRGYVLGGASVAVLAAAWVAYKVLYN